jgi:hypothetical protein
MPGRHMPGRHSQGSPRGRPRIRPAGVAPSPPVAVAGRQLDDVVPSHGDHPERTRDIRWIYLHMIEEYARHNGHADLIRERIDGVTGD